MRRRGDRALKEKAAAEEETKSAGRKAEQGEEGYQCTGLLEQDLPDLCARAGLTRVPKVTPRPPPSFPPDEEPPEPPLSEVLARIRHKYSCFQPRIQVELEHEDPRSVRAVFLRGWKLEENFLGVLSQCLPALANLQAVHLWKVGLTERSLPALAALLARCPGLRTLSLEGSPLPDAAFQTLMGSESKLAHLSLRNTGLGDAGAGVVGQSLGSSGRGLRSLVLSFNRISDLGAAHIAQGLRLNRSLLSLSLASNDIGDAGATKLAEVLGPFALTHAEIIEWRRLLLGEALGRSRTTSRERGGHGEHHSSAASAKHSKTPTRRKELPRKEEARQHKKRERGSEGLAAGHRGGCARSPVAGAPEPRGARSRDPKTSGHEKSNPEAPDASQPPHPLLEARQQQGAVVLPGNRALLNLNLSHNRIAERGLAAFLAALEAQQQENQAKAAGQRGLLRLSLEMNRIPPTSPALARLRELLPPQDPFPKPPGREEEQERGA